MSTNWLEIGKKWTCFIIFALGSNKSTLLGGSQFTWSADKSTVKWILEVLQTEYFPMWIWLGKSAKANDKAKTI